MKASELIKKYISFFKSKKHKEIPNSSLIPEHDPTVLFTTAGMHPLVPFLLGQKHPLGKRLVNVQKCIRTSDINLVGNDPFHLSFFEMLGNWSLGDYWKEEAINYSYEFLTKILKIDPENIYVTCFKGLKKIPKDTESARIWKSIGIPQNHIYFYKQDNWWGPIGRIGPCGPDTEIFIDTKIKKCSKNCKPGCSCGKYFEIWNDVFMEYNKTKTGKFVPLKQKNVDTGMGVERTITILQNKKSVYETELFSPIIEFIKQNSKKYNETSARVIADHLKAAVFILGDENSITPSNIDQGYILRRFIRRSITHLKFLKINSLPIQEISKIIINIYKNRYPLLQKKKGFILEELEKEKRKFSRTLEKGLNKFNFFIKNKNKISGKEAFLLYQSFGFPIEITQELASKRNIKININEFKKEFKKHQERSKKGAEKKFRGGLIDSSYETIKLHTANHLLLYALRKVLKDENIMQKGSNITPERLRFDFNFPRKLTEKEIKQVENLVNKLIKQKIPVIRKEMDLKKAKQLTKTPFEYKTKKVSVYFIGPSIEICMGPHVKNTSELGKFKIIKEESSSAGIRRIRAILE